MSSRRYIDLDLLAHEGRERVEVRGADSRRFLQGLLSADVEQLRAGEGIPAALLTAKGKIVSDAVLFTDGSDRYGLLVPHEQRARVVELLERHVIMDEVEIAWREGERCALVLEEPGGAPAEPEGPELFADVVVLRVRYPARGRLLVGRPARLRELLADDECLSAASWARLRVGEGLPAWGHEIEEGRFPPEVGLAAAVSHDKGCYLGQEPLARIHARGQVNHVLVRLRADVGATARLELVDDAGKPAGAWTTWIDESCGEGLGIVARRCATEGVELRDAAGRRVTVASGPLGDDPGVSGPRA